MGEQMKVIDDIFTEIEKICKIYIFNFYFLKLVKVLKNQFLACSSNYFLVIKLI